MDKSARKITAAAFAVAAVLGTTSSAQAGERGTQQTDYAGCKMGYVCVYPNASWNNDTPEHRYYTYGVHKFSNEYGVHRVFNNQTGGATAALCRNSNGTDCTGKMASWTWWDPDLTPYNSIRLDPS